MANDYTSLFQRITGHAPYDYQMRIGESPWPDWVDVPTGLGKTAAVGIAWLYKRLADDAETPRRLVYCLPMRVLVEQTQRSFRQWVEAATPAFEAAGRRAPEVHLLMGGDVDAPWAAEPERDAVIIGTQDMLLSRALMRGYGMSRYQWAIHFALLHNDALWVYDEVQLMGPALATSAQLEGLRRDAALAPARPTRSLWLSATLNSDWLATVDLREHLPTMRPLTLSGEDAASPAVRDRREAGKPLCPAETRLSADHTNQSGRRAYAAALAAEVQDEHARRDRGDTLVVLNTVERAQAFHDALAAADAAPLLVHARFRPHERRAIEATITDPTRARRIVVATQAIEAGVDLSSACLFSELAPWSSMVQRFGRCNRYGEHAEAPVYWIDCESDDKLAAPYSAEDLDEARTRLSELTSASPVDLPAVVTPAPVTNVLRRRDLLGLFNTEPDLSGQDIDISPYIRDTGGPQLQVFWRAFDERPSTDIAPSRDELCPVSMSQFQAFNRGNRRAVFRWDGLAGEWRHTESVAPGVVILIRATEGGYDPERGFSPDSRRSVTPVPPGPQSETNGFYDGDATSQIGRYVPLTEHLGHVAAEAQRLCEAVDPAATDAVTTAGRWHDVGKAHPAFQSALLAAGREPPEEAATLWAKSDGSGRLNYRVPDDQGGSVPRPRFRHELASLLAWIEHGDGGEHHDLIAYLIAAHHGKVRLGLRALPEENAPPEPDRRFARGVWEGDTLPPVRLNGHGIPATALRLDLMELGRGPQGPSWTERTQRLLAEHGPFRLAWLETLVRVADQRASRQEQEGRA